MIAALIVIALAAWPAASQSRPPQTAAHAAADSAPRETLIANAAAALRDGRRADAARLLAELGDRFHSVAALLQLARLQSGDGHGTAALETLQKARALAPNSEEVLSAIGQLGLAAGVPALAAGALDALTRMCPEEAQHQYLLGIALLSVGDAARATDALEAADRIEPGRPLTLAALGLALNNRKQFSDARTALTRSLELDPESAESTAALAEAEASLGDVAAAEAHARRALEIAPGTATAHLVVGMVRLQESRFEEARDALIKAAAADPLSAKVDYQLSLVYARLGDTVKAERSLELYRRKLAMMAERIKALGGNAAPRDARPGGTPR